MILTKISKQLIGGKWAARWECGNSKCGYVDIDSKGYQKPKNIESFIGREKVCPKCKSLSQDDYMNNVRLKIDALTTQRSNIDVEIEKLLKELVLEDIKQL